MGFHKWICVADQISKRVVYGDAPAARVKEICSCCGEVKISVLNICMPESALYEKWIWKDCKWEK